ncbi:MAG TPA: hypothetical protein VGR00_00595, partial [Thermoanaerobaculia bacterium]|nr:hypothetical protein [Thermoanaerobaculia bacterium]
MPGFTSASGRMGSVSSTAVEREAAAARRAARRKVASFDRFSRGVLPCVDLARRGLSPRTFRISSHALLKGAMPEADGTNIIKLFLSAGPTA